MRRRRLARRLFVKRYLTAAKRMAGAGVTIIAYPMVIVAWLRDADASVPAVTLHANGQK
jgi:hypothetical protein